VDASGRRSKWREVGEASSGLLWADYNEDPREAGARKLLYLRFKDILDAVVYEVPRDVVADGGAGDGADHGRGVLPPHLRPVGDRPLQVPTIT
jgi:hypothetical protein